MRLVVSLAVHAASFWMGVGLVDTTGVLRSAWIAVYAIGVFALVAASLTKASGVAAKTWAATLLYSCLFATIFAGADFALTALGNSVRPRAALPQFVGGLALQWLLAPGVAAVALGALAGKASAGLAGWLVKQTPLSRAQRP